MRCEGNSLPNCRSLLLLILSSIFARLVEQLHHPTASIVAGGTAVGLQLNDWRGPKDGAGRRAAAATVPSHMLSTISVRELHGCEVVNATTDSGAMLAGEFDESTDGDPTSSLLHVPDRQGTFASHFVKAHCSEGQ